MNKRLIPTDDTIDLFPTLLPVRRGTADPTTRLQPGVAWRATRSPDGPVTVQMQNAPASVEVEAWGPGAEWALEHAPDLIGANDDPSALKAHHPLVAELQRRMHGVRFPSWPTVVEITVPTVLEQKIVGKVARKSYARLVHRYGEPAPGPQKLRLPPTPESLAQLPYFELHPYGIEKRRAAVIKEVCLRARRLEQATQLPSDQRRRRLEAINGIGTWTSAEVARIAWGDPDAVSLNDFHIPHTVSWALAGEPRGTDERMLELLEPYEGQRARVVRLIEAAGIAAPKFGPRQRIQPIATI